MITMIRVAGTISTRSLSSSTNQNLNLIRPTLSSALASTSSSRSSSVAISLPSIRSIHSSSSRSADPLTGPTQLRSAESSASPLPSESALANSQTNVKYPDYSKGPSAIDKASQLFFFTEILRGTSVIQFNQLEIGIIHQS